MVDTPNRSDDNYANPPDTTTVVVEPRNRSSGLVWLLLLLALAVLGWWWFSQRSTLDSDAGLPPMDGTPTTATPEAIQIGDGNALPAETVDRDAAAPARRAPVAKPKRIAKVVAPRMIAAAPLGNPQPDYPRDAQRRGESGTVVLRVNVAADGSASDVEFVQRSGSQLLDRAAQQAVRKWRFRPATRDKVAVASTVEVPVVFTLAAN